MPAHPSASKSVRIHRGGTRQMSAAFPPDIQVAVTRAGDYLWMICFRKTGLPCAPVSMKSEDLEKLRKTVHRVLHLPAFGSVTESASVLSKN